MSNSFFLRALCVVHLTVIATGMAWADPGDPSPASGTVSPSAPTVQFTGTTTVGSNVAGSPPQVGDLGYDPCFTGVAECDEFTLTVSVPAGYAAAHPGAEFLVNLDWVDGSNDYDIYVNDANLNLVGYSATAGKPEQVMVPVVDGDNVYYVDIVPWQVTLGEYTGTIDLNGDLGGGGGGTPPNTDLAAPTPTAPGLPRFQNFVAPADSAGYDMFQGEFSIGYNPATQHIMTMAAAEVFRLTLPENLDPALPESCDALWEDKSAISTSGAPGLDPILFTDQDSGRTFSSNFTGGANAEYAFTDNDGDLWVPAGISPPNGGVDHQTIGSGPYPSNSPFAAIAAGSGFNNAVYYCSQYNLGAACQRSDDGGVTFGPGVSAYDEITGSCTALHGHVRVAPNGNVYLPTALCGSDSTVGGQGGGMSSDAGVTWQEFHVPGLTTTDGTSSDPSVAIDDANNLYFCTVDADGHPKVAVSQDNGTTWSAPFDLGASLGITQAAFPEAIAGDDGRAACGFLAAKTDQTNWQSLDYDGVWYVYIATTYDHGQTWTLSNATPNDPAQGTGGICLSGQGCNSSPNNRNLLDFNEITLDQNGYVLYGYDDGCIKDCVTDPTNGSFTATMSVARQIGGSPLRAGHDETFVTAPKRPCLSGAVEAGGFALSWKAPDDGGSSIGTYTLTRVSSADQSFKRITVSGQSYTDPDNTIGSGYTYAVKAQNIAGTSAFSNPVGDGNPVPDNLPPVATLTATPIDGSAPLNVTFTVGATDPDGDTIAYSLDFGDGSSAAVGTTDDSVSHSYGSDGTYTATLTVSDGKGGTDTTAVQVTVRPGGNSGGSNTAPVATLSVSPTTGTAPLDVTFVITGSDADGDPLHYTLDFGDGTSIANGAADASVPHHYATPGSYVAQLTLTDGKGGTDTATATVIATASPAPSGVANGGALGLSLLVPLAGAAFRRRRR